jgi:hypothetical protein
VWLYTREDDTTQLERGRGMDLELGVLATMLSKLSLDPSSIDLTTPLVHYTTICMKQAVRSQLLKVMPTLDDIDITTRQRGDLSHSVHIPETDAATGGGGGGGGEDSAVWVSFQSSLPVSTQ